MMVGAFLMVIGYYLFLLPPVTPLTKDAPSAEIVATTILIHQKAAIDWCLRTSCADGDVPADGLTLPPGYGAAPWVKSVAFGGLVSTYVTGLQVNTLAIATSLGDLTTGGPSAGLTAGDSTIVARNLATGRSAVAVVPGVPAGVPAISQKVK